MSELGNPLPIEVAEQAIESLAAFATRIGRRWRDPAGLPELVDRELFHIEGTFSSYGERSKREFFSVPELIQHEVGNLPLFEAATLSHAATHLAGPSWGTNVPEDARYVFSGLAARAISTVREIAILLDHGFALGAKSRWRTLSEILVVARVIAMGDRYTAARYKEHRWIVLAMERGKTGETQWAGDLPSPERMKGRLVKRFGGEYSTLYGWAARVSTRELGLPDPRWHHLQSLAQVDEHLGRVHTAHHAVHGADALGLLGTVDVRSGLFHAGSSDKEVLQVARDTTRLFRQTLAATFDICLKYSSERKPRILQSTVEAHLFNLEQSLGWQILSQDAGALEKYEAAMNNLFGDIADKWEEERDVIE